MSTPFQLIIPRAIYDDMIAQARSELPNECCGLLAGRIQESGVRSQESEARGPKPEITDSHSLKTQESNIEASLPIVTVVQRYPLVNAAASPTEYMSEARSMFEAVRAMRPLGLEIVAIYHSHPTSAPQPSRTDLERNYSPEVVNLIISLKDGVPLARAWWLQENSYREADWRLSD